MRATVTAMVGALCVAGDASAHAQSLVGTWQAKAGNNKGVVQVTRLKDGRLHAEVYYLGQEFSGNTRNGNPVSTIAVQGRYVHFDLDESPGTFDGELSADGDTIQGTWASPQGLLPLKFDRATKTTAWAIDPSPHKVRFVTVEPGVQLEVLDWGGEGPPLTFLAGHGCTAHEFDGFAPKFTGKHHVYGITRRGWGMSSKPEPNDYNYDSDRLGDDVLAVMDALKLDRPVIAGHSLAGQELSSIGARHPERVAGLVYLDASYAYAFYSPTRTDERIGPDSSILRRDLRRLYGPNTPSQTRALIQEMQETLPRLREDLQTVSGIMEGQSDPLRQPHETLRDRIDEYLDSSGRKYTDIKAQVLAIVATPKPCGNQCDAPQVKASAASQAAQADAFQAGVPSAHVVRIANAQHFVFLSNEADVVREMNAFMDGLR